MKYSDLGVVVLAAGKGSRMGAIKQLLPWKNGNLLTHCLEVVGKLTNAVVVVLGAYASEIQTSIHQLEHYDVVENDDWATGMGSSIAAGVKELTKKRSIEKILIVLVDQPLISYTYLEQLVSKHEDKKSIVVSNYKGTPGVPAVFGKAYFKDLRDLNGKKGAKNLLLQYKNQLEYLPENKFTIDLDTPEMYQHYYNLFGR
ncbi:NTP transferase domain-containing protein [Croceivirga sp. JEA036]|uniref:nucleotidyltransferase family protein n=1 Tax=Croceivirga sp. JEA036 TaxID=2721162 RepID=UPI00143AA0BF|nr:nucleotidyltransferase family protein [Croceivirga sp. JEA036]NJB35640.1 nucleotidyltransferase family protein [Croceivirga sp. JEA036]